MTIEPKPYFHELSQTEVDQLIQEKTTWEMVMDRYAQPDWCVYQDALSGIYGCWTLTDLSPTSNRSQVSPTGICKLCDDCKPKYESRPEISQ
ncbi:hypothetical protein CLV58_109236 [Spirosoma oryzae]|uniref:Uncharacterized protein n=1 Tax=Spirosoma oryzae TaxID=1469603 RepID=A0A2T0SYP0_9BACT|nr:hypothetical protein CLV58_109236 [Spirosoma oryzae]